MALRLLLDEQISPVVADQLLRHRPQAEIQSLHGWHEGTFLGTDDHLLVRAAAREAFTLVSYDKATLPEVLKEIWRRAASITEGSC